MAYVPFEGDLNKNKFPIGPLGKKFQVHLPEIYQDGQSSEEAVVVKMPFTDSKNANTREVIDT